MNTKPNHYESLLTESIESVKNLNDALIQGYGTSNTKQIESFLPNFQEAINKLEIILPKEHKPRWVILLKELLKPLNNTQAPADQIRLSIFDCLARYRVEIESLSVDTILSIPVVDFDEILDRNVKEKNIDGLYKKSIQTLRSYIEIENIDKVSVRSDLQEILDTLQSSKNSTSFNKICSAQFVWTFAKQLGKEYISDSKAGKALKNSLNELGINAGDVIGDLSKEVQEAAKRKAIELNHDFLKIENEKSSTHLDL